MKYIKDLNIVLHFLVKIGKVSFKSLNVPAMLFKLIYFKFSKGPEYISIFLLSLPSIDIFSIFVFEFCIIFILLFLLFFGVIISNSRKFIIVYIFIIF